MVECRPERAVLSSDPFCGSAIRMKQFNKGVTKLTAGMQSCRQAYKIHRHMNECTGNKLIFCILLGSSSPSSVLSTAIENFPTKRARKRIPGQKLISNADTGPKQKEFTTRDIQLQLLANERCDRRRNRHTDLNCFWWEVAIGLDAASASSYISLLS